MTIVRWNPFRDVPAFEDRMSRMLEGSSYGRFQEDLARSAWVRAVDIYSNGPYEVVLKAERLDMKQEESRAALSSALFANRNDRKEVDADPYTV